MVELQEKTKQIVSYENETVHFKGETTCKDMRSWIQSRINLCSKRNQPELELLFRECMKAYNNFHPIKEAQIDVEGWKGKSSYEMIKGIHKLTIVKFQKPFKGEQPVEVRTEVSKSEIIAIITAIKRLWKNEPIETRKLAFEWCIELGMKTNSEGKSLIDGDFWSHFFAWRSMHNKFTLLLGALDKLELVKYKGGHTTLLEEKIDVSLVL